MHYNNNNLLNLNYVRFCGSCNIITYQQYYHNFRQVLYQSKLQYSLKPFLIKKREFQNPTSIIIPYGDDHQQQHIKKALKIRNQIEVRTREKEKEIKQEK